MPRHTSALVHRIGAHGFSMRVLGTTGLVIEALQRRTEARLLYMLSGWRRRRPASPCSGAPNGDERCEIQLGVAQPGIAEALHLLMPLARRSRTCRWAALSTSWTACGKALCA